MVILYSPPTWPQVQKCSNRICSVVNFLKFFYCYTEILYSCTEVDNLSLNFVIVKFFKSLMAWLSCLRPGAKSMVILWPLCPTILAIGLLQGLALWYLKTIHKTIFRAYKSYLWHTKWSLITYTENFNAGNKFFIRIKWHLFSKKTTKSLQKKKNLSTFKMRVKITTDFYHYSVSSFTISAINFILQVILLLLVYPASSNGNI